MSDLNAMYAQYPQVLVNVTANDAQKQAYKEDEESPVSLRPSSRTYGHGPRPGAGVRHRPKIRVMVEGEDLEAIKSSADRVADKINKRILGQ